MSGVSASDGTGVRGQPPCWFSCLWQSDGGSFVFVFSICVRLLHASISIKICAVSRTNELFVRVLVYARRVLGRSGCGGDCLAVCWPGRWGCNKLAPLGAPAAVGRSRCGRSGLMCMHACWVIHFSLWKRLSYLHKLQHGKLVIKS